MSVSEICELSLLELLELCLLEQPQINITIVKAISVLIFVVLGMGANIYIES